MHGSSVVEILKKYQQPQPEFEGMIDIHEKIQKDTHQSNLLKPYSLFFKRVLHISAVRVQQLCQQLLITDRTQEMIWSLFQVLLAQETDLLMDRHLDQLIICTVYGTCKVHFSQSFLPQHDQNGQLMRRDPGNLFKDINDAYGVVTRNNSQIKNRLLGPIQNYNYILMEVTVNNESKDIIAFYNMVFIERMKEYILASRNMPMEQGPRTPVLNKSNFSALLTPGGREPRQKIIDEFIPMTPLVD